MRKVSMNEQQFERFITENAIRVAQRYLMEAGELEVDEEPEVPGREKPHYDVDRYYDEKWNDGIDWEEEDI